MPISTGRVAAEPSLEHCERLSRLEAVHGDALFARGFLLCREHPAFVPQRWRRETAGAFHLFHDPRVPLHWLRSDAVELLLLGDAYDLRTPTRGNRDVALDLFRALGQSARHLHELTDWLHGRFVIAYRDRPEAPLRLLADATGLRAVFHTDEGDVVGSHAALVAVNAGKARHRQPPAKFGFPGRATAYADVLVLVPNHELLVGSDRIVRFFPRVPLMALSSDAVAEAASHWLQNAVLGIAARHPRPVASLTAGLDSRTTLAASRAVARAMRFFTYYRSDEVDTDRADRAIAPRLATALGLRHDLLLLRPYQAACPESFRELCDELTYYRHIQGAAFAYTQLFDPATDVHIRSNLSEIGRCFYLKTRRVTAPLTSGRDLAAVYGAFARQKLTDADRAALVGEFDRYFDDTSFGALEGLRDTRDMLYWEHRMGVWHSLAVLESDPAFQTYSIFNARQLLDLLMSAPEADRLAGDTLRRVIQRCWPECLDFPFNPKEIAQLGLVPGPGR